MEKMILIAGKDYPDGSDFSSTAVLKGDLAVITANADSKDLSTEDGSVLYPWNRASALSSRSLVLNCVNKTGKIDEAYIIFDEEFYASKYSGIKSSEIAKCVDELILGYQYLVSELISRFSEQKASGFSKIIFIYKENIAEANVILNSNNKINKNSVSNVLVSAAGSAFKSFAQNIVAKIVNEENILPILIDCENDNVIYRKDSELASWLYSFVAQIETQKKPLTAKQKVSWIKAGVKSSGGFGLFK